MRVHLSLKVIPTRDSSKDQPKHLAAEELTMEGTMCIAPAAYVVTIF